MKNEIKYFIFVFMLGSGAILYFEGRVNAVEKNHERKYVTKEIGQIIIQRLDKIDDKLDRVLEKEWIWFSFYKKITLKLVNYW